MKNKVKCLISLGFLLLINSQVWTANYSLEACISKALEKSEYSKQDKQFDKQLLNERENLSSAFLPQIKLEAAASYQSDVFKMDLNIPIPGISIPSAPKEQYSASLNIMQTIYEGGYLNAAKESKAFENAINKLNTKLNNQRLEETITDYYFSVILLQETEKVLNNLKSNLEIRRNQSKSLVENGAVLPSSINNIDIELLKVEQKLIQNQKDKITLQKMISIWIEDNSVIGSDFISPQNIQIDDNIKYNRPEYELFEQKSKLLENKKNESQSQVLPNIYAYAKAGVGNPNPFNMAKDGTDLFYTFGLKFQWNVFDWGNNSRIRENLELSKEQTNIEKSIFDKQFENSIIAYKEDISKYENLLVSDSQILELQKKICDNSFSQFSNGTMTVADYLIDLNNLTQYDINLNTHKSLLLSAKVKLLTKTNNLK